MGWGFLQKRIEYDLVVQGGKNDLMIVLTEGLELIEADGALALGSLDATCVKDMIALKQPYFLRIRPIIKLQFAMIASIPLVNKDSTT